MSISPERSRRLVFFGNSCSRQGRNGFEQSLAAFERHDVELEKYECFDEPKRMLDAVQQAVDDKVDIIAIGGGDGTVGMCADRIVKSESALAIVPLGTGNQLALELGLPRDFAKVVADVILGGKTARLDAASVNGNVFLNVATIGLTTEIANNLTAKDKLGKFAYITALVKAFRKIEPFTVHVEDHIMKKQLQLVQLVICNGRTHGGPFVAAPDATMSDGHLDVYGVKHTNIFKMLKAGAMALGGEHVNLDDIPAFKTSKFTLTTDPKLPITMDGESVWHDTMTVEVLPASIKMRVPQTFRVPNDRLVSKD